MQQVRLLSQTSSNDTHNAKNNGGPLLSYGKLSYANTSLRGGNNLNNADQFSDANKPKLVMSQTNFSNNNNSFHNGWASYVPNDAALDKINAQMMEFNGNTGFSNSNTNTTQKQSQTSIYDSSKKMNNQFNNAQLIARNGLSPMG